MVGESITTQGHRRNAPARFAVYDWHRNQNRIQEEGYVTDLIAAGAKRVIAARKYDDRPLFMCNALHVPLRPP